MLVELAKTSNRTGKPHGLAKKETRLITMRCTCATLEDVRNHRLAADWFFREGGVNHREENGMTAVDFEREAWVAEIDSFEWAAREWKSIVIEPSNVVGIEFKVEIYDGYRE